MEPEKKLSTSINPKSPDPISYFEKEGDFASIFKKTEKLASALYLVTSLFSESEPMKWSLRRKVSELLSFNLNYKDAPNANHPDFVYNVKTRVLELVSLLEVSMRGGLISDMNFSILKQEFSNLIAIFETSRSAPGGPFKEALSGIFFEDASQKILQPSDSQNMAKNYPISAFPDQPGFAERSAYNPEIKDRQAGHVKDDQKRSNRQTIILNLIRKKKEVTIKDVAQVIKDCSEKTIQRELNSFIALGVVKRAGVRRWSKYSLAG